MSIPHTSLSLSLLLLLTLLTSPLFPTLAEARVSRYISESLFNKLFPLMRNPSSGCCPTRFYTYKNFIQATKQFPHFAGGNDHAVNKREIAAFLGQASQETNGAAPGHFNGGLCFVQEGGCNPTTAPYCVASQRYPCARGVSYHGRGPLQLSYNYNYIPAGKACGFDGLHKPNTLAQKPVKAWCASLWFWMTPRNGKPSCHNVITGNTHAEPAKGRYPGFGWTTNVINGGVLGCGSGVVSDAEKKKIGYYKKYCDALGVGYGDHVNCAHAQHY